MFLAHIAYNVMRKHWNAIGMCFARTDAAILSSHVISDPVDLDRSVANKHWKKQFVQDLIEPCWIFNLQQNLLKAVCDAIIRSQTVRPLIVHTNGVCIVIRLSLNALRASAQNAARCAAQYVCRTINQSTVNFGLRLIVSLLPAHFYPTGRM